MNDSKRLINDIPLVIGESSRFGNPAFRDWMQKLVKAILPKWQESIKSLVDRNFLSDYVDSFMIAELSSYFENSFGSSIRIDYGTGHELSFLAFLCCCEKLQCWTVKKSGAIVNILMRKYLDLVRTLQKYFKLEPAGSHGVWGLDDYQFLPFVFGSSQLSNCKTTLLCNPGIVMNKEIVNIYKDDYLYLDSIAFIYKMKSGPFYEHSPILYDISGLSTWEKINSGMLKMYKKEVLGKFPIVQHFLFGKLLPWNIFT